MANYWDNLMENDENAASYMETYGEGPGCETRHIISSFINDGETVLDVGCGPGWNLDHFDAYGPNIDDYLGLDLSSRFVRIANQRHPLNDLNPRRHKFYALGDCRELKQKDFSWDVVILQDVLEHTNGFEKPVLEALRVARKRIIISFWHLKDDDNPHINDDRDKGEDGYGAWYDKREWIKFLNTLDYIWFETETSPEANRQHTFFIIDKDSQ
jgi:SAM-dependent methyltransferase